MLGMESQRVPGMEHLRTESRLECPHLGDSPSPLFGRFSSGFTLSPSWICFDLGHCSPESWFPLQKPPSHSLNSAHTSLMEWILCNWDIFWIELLFDISYDGIFHCFVLFSPGTRHVLKCSWPHGLSRVFCLKSQQQTIAITTCNNWSSIYQ